MRSFRIRIFAELEASEYLENQVKSTAVRPAVTATTAGLGNVPVSIMEDVISTVVSFLSILIPILLMVLAVLIALWIFFIVRRRRKKKYAQSTMDASQR